jgi:hypothetical protein
MLPQMSIYINPSEAKLYEMYHKLLDEIYLISVEALFVAPRLFVDACA